MDISHQAKLLTVRRRELFDLFKSSSKKFASHEKLLVDYLQDKFKISSSESEILEELRKKIHTHVTNFNRNWKSCHRTKEEFLKKHAAWLDGHLSIKVPDDMIGKSSRISKRGRPKKNIDSCAVNSIPRKIKPLVQSATLTELTHATRVKLNKSGKRDAACILGELVSSPKRANKVKNAFYKQPQKIRKYSPDEALALMISAKLSQRKYNVIRKSAKSMGSDIYPSYDQIKSAKKLCYPSDDDCVIDESMAEIKLQSLVDLTIKRLCVAQSEVLKSAAGTGQLPVQNLNMVFKWGCDGSGGQSRYKQLPENKDFEDSNILATSLVPLQLYGYSQTNKRSILWQNPRPSSTSYCRPIKFSFQKETEESVLEEFNNVRDQIKTLSPTLVDVNGCTFNVFSTFEETMVDGKICNILANNKSTQKCYICGATSKDMNNLELIRKREPDAGTSSWGLSTLHAQIRFMECVLHIGYKLEVKKWQCRTKEDKESVKDRKKHILKKFRLETGLLLDTPKQGGGNTNDGNSARKFFRNASIAASITGVNENLIQKFHTILRTITSGYEIDIEAFKSYCDETADLYVSLYRWYPMPVTLHKILLHGPDIIKNFLLPIGQLSEEAQEARHKEFKKFRLEYSRKMSRRLTNTDILHNLLISSDPLITSLKAKQTIKATEIDPAVLRLLKAPEIENEEEMGADLLNTESEASDCSDTN